MLPKSTEGLLLRDPASHDFIAFTQHGHAQTARLVRVLDIIMGLTLLGAALVFDIAARQPGSPWFQAFDPSRPVGG